ncbi:hypothetical protein BDV10DRAFT_189689 [Aspergillus recurvatus]
MSEEHAVDESVSCHSFTIGWICVLQEEYDAAYRMLDVEIEGVEADDVYVDDDNVYTFGTIGGHRIMIGCLRGPVWHGFCNQSGERHDALFPNLRLDLMVGIEGELQPRNKIFVLETLLLASPTRLAGALCSTILEKRLPDGRFQRTELNVLCFEMEAAGLMNDFSCLIIRGVSRSFGGPRRAMEGIEPTLRGFNASSISLAYDEAVDEA